MEIKPFHASVPIVTQDLKPTQDLRIFSEQVSKLCVLSGSASPESVVESNMGRFYINTTGGVGTTLYAKVFDDIGGDRTKGWKAI